MRSHRLPRVAEAIREVVSTTILTELKDPRIQNVTVTRVEVTGDLRHSKVHVSIMGSEKQQKLALYGLQHAAGFLQKKVADRLQTRYTPVLKFALDPSVKKSIEISQLIDRTLAEDAARRGTGEAATPADEDGEPTDEDAEEA